MKGSEILKMVEDVLPECMNVRSCKGIYKVVIHDDDWAESLDPGEYGVVDLSLTVRLDTPALDRSKFEAMKGALEIIHKGLYGENHTSDIHGQGE